MASRTTPLRRLALLVVALAVCTGAGWQLGRIAGPALPGIDIPATGGHNH